MTSFITTIFWVELYMELYMQFWAELQELHVFEVCNMYSIVRGEMDN